MVEQHSDVVEKAISTVFSSTRMDRNDVKARKMIATSILSAVRLAKQRGRSLKTPMETDIVRIAQAIRAAEDFEDLLERVINISPKYPPDVSLLRFGIPWLFTYPVPIEFDQRLTESIEAKKARNANRGGDRRGKPRMKESKGITPPEPKKETVEETVARLLSQSLSPLLETVNRLDYKVFLLEKHGHDERTGEITVSVNSLFERK